MATLFKRGKTWYISYMLDGKRIKRSLETRSKTLAEREKARLEVELDKGKLGQAPKLIKPIDALEEIMENIKRTKSKPTKRRYYYSLKSLRDFFIEAEGIRTLKTVRKSHIDSLMLIRDTEVKEKTYNEELGLIKMFFEWAKIQGYISENPVLSMERKHRVPPPPRAYTKEEVDIILENANDAHRDIYEFLLNTGLRSGEMSHLEWNDVDLEKGIIYIRVKKEWHPKTISNRTVPLNARAREILLRQPKRSNLVFTTRTGGSQFDIYNRFRYLIKKINEKHGTVIENPTIHAFRHTFATHALQSGIDIYTVSRYLGHTSVKMTEKYLTLLPDYAMQEIEKLKY